MKKSIALTTLFALALAVLLGACAPTVQKTAAKDMIKEAEKDGAKNDAEARQLLQSAEDKYDRALKNEKKLKMNDAKYDYERAYDDALEAWETIAEVKGQCKNCPSGTGPQYCK